MHTITTAAAVACRKFMLEPPMCAITMCARWIGKFTSTFRPCKIYQPIRWPESTR
jgi:hypothetical protein